MARHKPWMDKGWLHDRYVKKKMTIDQIADECKADGISVTSMTIYNHLKKNNLIKNSRTLGKRAYGNNSKKGRGYY